jgi:hypothetical protein
MGIILKDYLEKAMKNVDLSEATTGGKHRLPMVKLFIKNVDKKLNQVDNIVREIQRDAKMIDNKIGGSTLFDSSLTLIGQIIGLTTTLYNELDIAATEIEEAAAEEDAKIGKK